MESETTFASARLTKCAREFCSRVLKRSRQSNLERVNTVVFLKNICRIYRERAIINIRNANAIIPKCAPPKQDPQVGLNQ